MAAIERWPDFIVEPVLAPCWLRLRKRKSLVSGQWDGIVHPDSDTWTVVPGDSKDKQLAEKAQTAESDYYNKKILFASFSLPGAPDALSGASEAPPSQGV